jgi:CRP/FNR family transcriptional regulator, cyclic AMP receptor protein
MAGISETLGKFPLFRSLDAAAVRRLDQACAWQRARAGQSVLDYQAGGTDLFFVLHGHVRVMVISGPGTVILRDIRDGEFFGELAAIDGQPRSSAIIAATDTVLARMSAKVFRDVVHGYPDVCDQLLMLLASQIRMLANRVNEQSTLNVQQRIYAELVRLARSSAKGEAVISPPPTHAELASRVSARREAVTRELNALEKVRLIERRRGAIVLLDPAKLKQMIDPLA